MRLFFFYKKIEGKCTLDIDNKHEAKFECWLWNRIILHSGMILELQYLEVVLWMRLGSAQNNMNKPVVSEYWYRCSRWSWHDEYWVLWWVEEHFEATLLGLKLSVSIWVRLVHGTLRKKLLLCLREEGKKKLYFLPAFFHCHWKTSNF